MTRIKRLSLILAVGALAVAAWAQTQSSSTSNSSSKQGSASSSGSSSARASAGGSHSAGGGFSGSTRGAGSGSGNGSISIASPTHAVIFTVQGQFKGIELATKWMIESQYWQMQKGMVMAGPWREQDGGLVILSVGSDEEASKLVDNSPGIKGKFLEAEVRAWNPNVMGSAAR
ncbi:MAG: hypothetical protein ABL962_03430 [Fimbriimonadaceae bacterium]